MGVDIHMSIIDKDGNIVKKEIFEGRNSEWFDNLTQRCCHNEAYTYLPVEHHLPKNCCAEIASEVDGSANGYNPCHIEVIEFVIWYKQYLPHINAGWVTKREAWLYQTKGITPYDPKYQLFKDDVVEDYCFIEFEDKYECSTWLFNYISKYELSKEGYKIVYYFDC